MDCKTQPIGDAPGRAASPIGYPAYATLAVWQRLSGISRSRTYELLAAGHLRAIKLRSRTLIDVEAALAWMRTLPAAEIAPVQRAD
ncbi:MerR family transcriptional regulator [Acidisphaera rubrifaciens]|uniref:Helix-turn-helix domain-containing protein n=1 Tax=Acidisphaera rubrifaciens HS-AP3 TaxID=1231350 RepID=A0A0D6PAX9_9PROT|nr:hypothetical protein [Acidisphaera rubrifaciens]GAN78024.1 hypothetical protein Asru_0573_05 [Acidisphaera rubrifaciens HS-AP3]